MAKKVVFMKKHCSLVLCIAILAGITSTVYADTVQEYSVSYTIIWEDTFEEISSGSVIIGGMFGRSGVERKAYSKIGFDARGRKRTDEQTEDSSGRKAWRYQKMIINSVDWVREYQTRS
jgi:hypothetical protein